MSAIYGAIDFNGKGILKGILDRFRKNYQQCAIDRYEHREAHNAMFGCAIQYFTKEAQKEVLPVIDEENHLIFTADCVLDNREELLEKLEITDEEMPDGTILYRAYVKWREHCMDYARGVYSYAVYDWEKNEVYLSADQFANRCLYYHLRDGVLYFSTMLFPLLEASGLQYQENERWMIDCISLRGPAMLIEPRECAMQDVYKVDAGHYVKVNAHMAQYEQYWNPIKSIPTDKTITAQQCEQMVRECLQQSVAETIRTEGEVAIQLSSGLDSTTIAGFAAPLLKQQGKKLYSFTSIPLKETQAASGYYLDDESEGVHTMCKWYPNIEPAFVKCEDKNILTQAQNIVNIWEMPCKSEQNAVWISEIMQEAAQKGCKVILSGATGNCTLSAGALEDYLVGLVRRFHWIKAYRGLKKFTHKYRISRKKYVKVVAKQLWGYHTRYFNKQRMDCYKNIITRRDMGDKYQITKRYNKDILQYSPIKTIKTMREEIYLPKAYAQIGELDTKHSLAYGILVRDPLRNVSFIELCMKLPMECYVNDEYDRRIVREFMHDIVPEEIRLDIRHRGRQSADNAYRIAGSWNQYLPTIRELLLSQGTTRYLDSHLIDEYLSRLSADNLEEKEMDMRMIIDAYMMSLFIQRLQKYEVCK